MALRTATYETANKSNGLEIMAGVLNECLRLITNFSTVQQTLTINLTYSNETTMIWNGHRDLHGMVTDCWCGSDGMSECECHSLFTSLGIELMSESLAQNKRKIITNNFSYELSNGFIIRVIIKPDKVFVGIFQNGTCLSGHTIWKDLGVQLWILPQLLNLHIS